MNAFSFWSLKRTSVSLRVAFILFVVLFGMYICSVGMKQIFMSKSEEVLFSSEKEGQHCDIPMIPGDNAPFVHFPDPKTYKRDQCSCTPVHFFVLLSMQRSGSGWFETLLNSHPNISCNGEIFSIKERRDNVSSILKTLDTLYSLDWFSSSAKNDCVAAIGFKWMLNQGVMKHNVDILNYFKLNKVSIIFLFRRNLLRRLISVLANDYDRNAKQLNGTHKSHVHSKEEAEILARYKPVINTAVLLSDLSLAEQIMAECLQFFSSVRHIILYYEDVLSNKKWLSHIQDFLGVPVRQLDSRQVKIHTKKPSEQIVNWNDVYNTLNGTRYEHLLHNLDYTR